MRRIFYPLFCAVMMFSACGQQHDAEVLVKDFMNENLKNPTALTNVDFAKLDSTARLNDSIINVLRSLTGQSGRYRDDIRYSDKKQEKPLKILRVQYKIDTTECSDTYYLSRDITEVIAIKAN